MNKKKMNIYQKTVCIVTSIDSFDNNFGAVLQCFALCSQLKKWGYVPKVVNYISQNGKIKNNKNSLLKYIFSTDASFMSKIQYRLKRNQRQQIKNNFIRFKSKYLIFEPKNKLSFRDLENYNFNAKYFITGSDQVWNPINHGNNNDPCCFLQFTNQKRIAYAASFGVSFFPKECLISLKQYLDSFNTISVREESGLKIIAESNTIKNAVKVLDPTLMVDFDIFSGIDSDVNYNNLPKKYILVYRFGKLKYFQKILKQIKKHLSLPVIELPCSLAAYGKGTKLLYEYGPESFSKLISKATLVVTDSFHCTAFSILNKTPFLTFLRQDESDETSMNSRIYDILSEFKLESRIVRINTNFEEIKKNLLNIDFNDSDRILEKRKQESQNFLKKALDYEK